MGRADRQLAVMQIDTRRALNDHRFRSAWRPSRQGATSRAEPAFRAHLETRAGAIEMLAVSIQLDRSDVSGGHFDF
jgi:hypothetical protein